MAEGADFLRARFNGAEPGEGGGTFFWRGGLGGGGRAGGGRTFFWRGRLRALLAVRGEVASSQDERALCRRRCRSLRCSLAGRWSSANDAAYSATEGSRPRPEEWPPPREPA